MIRTISIFIATFVAGALIALVARAALFAPHAGHEGHPVGGGEYQSMVSNPLTPAPANPPAAKAPATTPAPAATPEPAPAAPAADPHAGHAASAPPAAGEPVNTICAICGMDVDPALPTAQYQGKTIGFGCRMCPPKFKANPDRYGPAYVRNELYKP
jgi:YHS domain-containing protein